MKKISENQKQEINYNLQNLEKTIEIVKDNYLDLNKDRLNEYIDSINGILAKFELIYKNLIPVHILDNKMEESKMDSMGSKRGKKRYLTENP